MITEPCTNAFSFCVVSRELNSHQKACVVCTLYSEASFSALFIYLLICQSICLPAYLLTIYLFSMYLLCSFWRKPRVSHMLDKCHNNQPCYCHSCLLVHALSWEPCPQAILWHASCCPSSSQTIFCFILVLSR